jgi:hypothetical protein
MLVQAGDLTPPTRHALQSNHQPSVVVSPLAEHADGRAQRQSRLRPMSRRGGFGLIFRPLLWMLGQPQIFDPAAECLADRAGRGSTVTTWSVAFPWRPGRCSRTAAALIEPQGDGRSFASWTTPFGMLAACPVEARSRIDGRGTSMPRVRYLPGFCALGVICGYRMSWFWQGRQRAQGKRPGIAR